jgi:hypothetical protein
MIPTSPMFTYARTCSLIPSSTRGFSANLDPVLDVERRVQEALRMVSLTKGSKDREDPSCSFLTTGVVHSAALNGVEEY